MDEDIVKFREWLKRNDCDFDRLIDWPSYDTLSGSRGAIAKSDILTNEVMLVIPQQLMISPPNAFKDPIIGLSLYDSKELLTGDILIAVYLAYEYEKGEDSFYYPYLKILPKPSTISEWCDDDLMELQDDSLALRAKRGKNRVKIMYECNVLPYRNKYTKLFTHDSLSYESFLFSWYSIQARAFGRRLPWTAMVPFADCLNHANVQTKYDYNVDDNGCFRLFPTGANKYSKGSEVFNSYGRRPNDNLLLDYGFSMLDNEWDQVVLDFCFSSSSSHYEKKLTFLYNSGKPILYSYYYHHYHIIIISLSGYNKDIQIKIYGDNDIPLDSLACLRIISLDDDEVKVVESTLDDLIKPNENIFQSRVSKLGKLRGFFENIISIRNELEALQKLKKILEDWQSSHLTSLEDDETILIDLNNSIDDDAKWRKISTVTYRLTRKRYVSRLLQIVQVITNNLSERDNETRNDLLDSVHELCESFRSASTSPSARTNKYIKELINIEEFF